ncbi:MAG: RcpC/CpaB family pilus assembly protein [Gaiellales bacterium]
MTYSVRNIVIALALAAVAGVLVIVYTGHVQSSATNSQKTVTVLVAKTDIAAGTPVREAIAAGAFETRQVIVRDQVPGAFGSLNELNRTLATAAPIAAQTQVTPAMFNASQQNPIQTQVKGVNRAVQIALNSNAVLSGTLRAGDHVDIASFCTLHPANQSSKIGDIDLGRIIMTDVPVLSTTATGAGSTALTADSQPAGQNGTLDGTTGQGVILSVPQTQVANLLYTAHYCGLWMADRPSVGAQDSPNVLATGCSVFAAGITQSQLKSYLPVCARGQ